MTDVAKVSAAEKKEKRIESVMKKSGWTHDEINASMKRARKAVGIKSLEYDKYDFWKIPEEEWEDEYERIQKKKAAAEERQEALIQSVMDKSGWTHDEAYESMKKVKAAIGISFRDYDRYDFWKISEELWKEEYDRILKNREAAEKKKESLIEVVMVKSGWPHDEAYADMKLAKKELGLTFDDYVKYDFWEIPKVEWNHAYEYVLARKEKGRKADHENISQIMENTGWDRDFTVKALKDAKKRLGASFTEYNRYQLYLYDIEEQESVYRAAKEASEQEKIRKAEEEEKQLEAEREEFVQKIMNETGWTHEEAIARYEEANERTGCTYKEFYMYRFDELDEKTQEELFLIVDSRKILEKYPSIRYFRRMLTNKELTNISYAKYLGRPWCVNTKISEADFVEIFKDSTTIFYKPLAGNRGIGVEKYDIDENNIKEVYAELAKLPGGVVEEYVVQHEKLSQLAPSSVNTIRIVTVSSNSNSVNDREEHLDFAYAALRIGGGDSIVDNFHRGGMVAAVDLETGRLITDGADQERHVYERHPLTGVKIKGFEIPMFQEAKKMIMAAYEETQIEGYLGWDIAITDEGPVLIEINLQPGADLLTTPFISEKRGMKEYMLKYI